MILSTTTSALFHTLGYETGIEQAARIGFDELDMNMCDLTEDDWHNEFSEAMYEDTCRKLRETAEKHHICFNQAHAPFPAYLFGNDKYNEVIGERIIRSIRIAGLLRARFVVIHPIECPEEIDQKQFNVDYYKSLIPYCKENGVKIALENLWRFNQETESAEPGACSYSEELADYYEALPAEYFGVCLDVGHCELVGEKAEDAL